MKDVKKEIKRKLKILNHILEVTRPSTYYMLKTYELADISKSDEEGWDLQWWDLDEYTKEIVGIIKDRIVGNSPYKVEFSLFQNLLRTQAFSSRFCIKIYNMAFIEKSADDENLRKELENLGIEICDVAKRETYSNRIKKLRCCYSRTEDDFVFVYLKIL